MVGKDYKATQALARKMSIDRAVQVMQERKISGSFGPLSAHDLESVARRIGITGAARRDRSSCHAAVALRVRTAGVAGLSERRRQGRRSCT
jgi:hypothetical protein